MMLIVHIWANQLDSWIVIGDDCLWTYLGRMSEPVAFFLFLGGYGLYCVREKGDKHRYSRILRLYIHFWIVLLLFFILTSLMKKSPVYPIEYREVLFNFTSFHISWNPVCQFLLPYVLLSLFYPLIFGLLDRFGIIKTGVCCFIVYGVAGSLYGKYGDAFIWEIPERFFFYLCPFVWGACLKKSDLIQKVKLGTPLACSLFILILFVKCVLTTNLFTPIYVAAFVFLFVKIPHLHVVDRALEIIGNHSMNMWFIHAWFCLVLFRDELYSLRYPLVVLIVLSLISYLVSVVVNLIAKPLNDRLFALFFK